MKDHKHANIGPCGFVTIDDVPIHYFDAGSGPVVVLVHGGENWSYSWRNQISFLVESGYRAVAIDMPGNGYSDPEVGDASIETQSRMLKKILTSLDTDSCVFVAHSLGGLPVLDLAIRNPAIAKGLVLDTTCGVPHPVSMVWKIYCLPLVGEAMALFTGPRLIRSGYKRMLKNTSIIDDEMVMENLKPMKRPGIWDAQLKIERSSRPEWVESHIKEIACPVCLIWGDSDPVHSLEMIDQFKQSVHVISETVLTNCGHVPHEEYPEEFNKAMLDFLKQISF